MIPVAILGATGAVGQKFVMLLKNHPVFEIREVVASARSAGATYRDAARWQQIEPIPDRVANLVVKSLDSALSSHVLFSGLDSAVAGEAESGYAAAGHVVISNAKNHRMDRDVPLVIPEVNDDHLDLIKAQRFSGAIVTNSNCSTMFLAMVLAPLHREFGVRQVHVTTMQAVSGAGYPGVPSMDILGNVIPFIADEEDKLESEPQKILGSRKSDHIEPAAFSVSAHCNRVAVYDGHTESVSIGFERTPRPDQVIECLRAFRGLPQIEHLPSAPPAPIVVTDAPDRPQPARDVWTDGGMTTTVGRVRTCPILGIRMTILGHNTIRGAAGAAVLNGETLWHKGYLK